MAKNRGIVGNEKVVNYVLMRKCKICEVFKPITRFSKKGLNWGKQQYRTECKACYYPIHRKYSISKPDKFKAQTILKNNVRSGKVKKPNFCTICGVSYPKNRIQGHHSDYTKPLEVAWVCGLCHVDIHKFLKIR